MPDGDANETNGFLDAERQYRGLCFMKSLQKARKLEHFTLIAKVLSKTSCLGSNMGRSQAQKKIFTLNTFALELLSPDKMFAEE